MNLERSETFTKNVTREPVLNLSPLFHLLSIWPTRLLELHTRLRFSVGVAFELVWFGGLVWFGCVVCLIFSVPQPGS